MKPAAFVFDMDGTLMDNNPYHFKAWQAFYKKYDRTLTIENYAEHINGRISRDIFTDFFGTALQPEDVVKYADEKNSLYRELYAPFIKPIDGLLPFLQEVFDAKIPMSIATSGTPANVAFMFEHIPIRHYFKHIVDSSAVTHGKPDPEIFLKAAASVNANPALCIGFEDSLAGIASAKAAGMKVVALTTMQKRDLIEHADLIIDNYTQLTVKDLLHL